MLQFLNGVQKVQRKSSVLIGVVDDASERGDELNNYIHNRRPRVVLLGRWIEPVPASPFVMISSVFGRTPHYTSYRYSY